MEVLERVVSACFPKSGDEAKLEKLGSELKALKLELHSISEMDEFAKYHRKRRLILKAQDEFDALSQKANKTKMYKYVKVNVICRIIIAIFAIIFSYLSRDIIVAKIDDRIFWPFNFLLTFPWIFTESDQGETPVSLCNFLVITSIFYRAYSSQKGKKALFKLQHPNLYKKQ